jgi:tRNA uridine 5-carbamoylmethylation protein Kti12
VITFKSTEDLSKLPPEDHAYPTVQELVDRLITTYTEPGHPYNWRDYGYVILIQEGDVNRTLDEIWDGCRLIDIPWEGIMLRDGFFIAIYLANNEYGLIFVLENADWVNGDLRQMIEDNLDPPIDSTKQEEFT